MSMECDTRLSMMALRERTTPSRQPTPRRRNTPVRRFNAASVSSMAAFALTLFTRSA